MLFIGEAPERKMAFLEKGAHRPLLAAFLLF